MSIELRAALRACVSACLDIRPDNDMIGMHEVLTDVRGAVSAMIEGALFRLQAQDLASRLQLDRSCARYLYVPYDHEVRCVCRSQDPYHVVTLRKPDGVT